MRWDSSPLFFEIILRNCLYICIVFKTEKDSIMETTAYTSDNIITRSYEEYHQVILNYITYRIAHRYEAEDLTQDVFVRLMDYKQMLRPFHRHQIISNDFLFSIIGRSDSKIIEVTIYLLLFIITTDIVGH